MACVRRVVSALEAGEGGTSTGTYLEGVFLAVMFNTFVLLRFVSVMNLNLNSEPVKSLHVITQVTVSFTFPPFSPNLAAKITRCGHVYCWSCLLHYLSLVRPQKSVCAYVQSCVTRTGSHK